jgi:hypothetical protein
MQALWMMIPEEAYILIIVGAGFALTLGFINISSAISIVVTICLIALLSPFIGSLMDLLPGWVLILILLCFVMSFVKAILGRRVVDGVLSLLIFEMIMLPFRIFSRLFRINRF